MIKKTITTLSVVALAAGTLALPAAAAGISSDAPVQIAACGPCKAKNPCNPCGAKRKCKSVSSRFYDANERPPLREGVFLYI